MDYLENKLELSLVVVLVAIFGFVFYIVGGFKTSSHKLFGDSINYEMPKSKSQFQAEFDLSDRGVDYEYSNPFEKAKAEAEKAAKAAAGSVKAQDAAKAQAAQKSVTANKAKDQKDKPKVDVNVVEATQATEFANDVQSNDQVQYGQMDIAMPVQKTQTATEKNEKKNKVSAQQWKALLQSQPTKANADSLLEAYASGDVEITTMNDIVTTLTKNQSSDVQTVGVYVAERIVSAQTFSIMTHQASQLDQSLQTRVNNYLMTYTQKDHVQAMIQVLALNDETVLTKATSLLLTQLNTLKVSGTTNIPTTGNQTGTTSSITYFQRYLTVLQKQTQNQDTQISQTATQAYQQISSELA